MLSLAESMEYFGEFVSAQVDETGVRKQDALGRVGRFHRRRLTHLTNCERCCRQLRAAGDRLRAQDTPS